jgi:hypothetical protein
MVSVLWQIVVGGIDLRGEDCFRHHATNSTFAIS